LSEFVSATVRMVKLVQASEFVLRSKNSRVA